MKKKKNERTEKLLKNEILKKEVIKALSPEKSDKKEVYKSVIFDGRQYSVRIPKKFADAIGINTKKHVVKFILDISPNRQSLPKLSAEVVENEKSI